MVAMIRRTFHYLNEKNFQPLYKALVRSHLEYASSVWYPTSIKMIEQIENVHRRATKQIPGLRNLSYSDRLRRLKLPTLSYRRLRGDMIELFKITSGIYDQETCSFIKLWKDVAPWTGLRGHNKKIFPQQARTSLRKNSFSLRNINTWNNLPEDVVNAKKIKTFKNRLDRLWKNQDILYDHRAIIQMSGAPKPQNQLESDEEDLNRS